MKCRADEVQREAFLATLSPVAADICPRYNLDPAQCVEQAAIVTDCGRFVLGHNYWRLQGRGDAGAFLLLRPVKHGGRRGGGWGLDTERVARFSTLPAAVTAWCKAQRG